jgi:hypothetical protein
LQVGAAAIDGELVEAPAGRQLNVGGILGQDPDVLQRTVQPAESGERGVAYRLAREAARQTR